MTLEDLLRAIAEYVGEHCPGDTPTNFRVDLASGRKIAHPVFPQCCPATPARKEVFVPSSFQAAILEALEGKAMKTDALGAAVGDRSRLFKKPGGLKELQDHGLVAHHSRLGFYRPDAPPEELEAENE